MSGCAMGCGFISHMERIVLSPDFYVAFCKYSCSYVSTVVTDRNIKNYCVVNLIAPPITGKYPMQSPLCNLIKYITVLELNYVWQIKTHEMPPKAIKLLLCLVQCPF